MEPGRGQTAQRTPDGAGPLCMHAVVVAHVFAPPSLPVAHALGDSFVYQSWREKHQEGLCAKHCVTFEDLSSGAGGVCSASLDPHAELAHRSKSVLASIMHIFSSLRFS